MNRVQVKGKWYQYPRYQFSSRSDDIRHLFIDACDALEIAWRPWAGGTSRSRGVMRSRAWTSTSARSTDAEVADVVGRLL
jgi:hypothetical protein